MIKNVLDGRSYGLWSPTSSTARAIARSSKIKRKCQTGSSQVKNIKPSETVTDCFNSLSQAWQEGEAQGDAKSRYRFRHGHKFWVPKSEHIWTVFRPGRVVLSIQHTKLMVVMLVSIGYWESCSWCFLQLGRTNNIPFSCPPARPHVLLHRANAHVKPPKVHCFLLDLGFLNYCNSFAQKILLTQSLRNPLLSVTCPYLSIFNNERYGACANLPTWNPLQIFSPVTSSAKKQIPRTCFRQPVSQCCATHRCSSPHAKSFMEAAFGRLFRPERSWTILNLPKNYGKLLWTSDPASTWFPRRRYATPHRLVTYPYLGYGIYVANCSKVKSKTEAAAMTRDGWWNDKRLLIENSRKKKRWYKKHITEICLWKICPGDLKPLQATEAKFHQQKELRAPTTVAIHHGIQSDLGATVESWNMRYIIYVYVYYICIIYIYIYIYIYMLYVIYNILYIILYIYYIIYIYTSLGGWCLPENPREFHAGLQSAVFFGCMFFFCKLRTYKILLFPTSHGIFALTYYASKITFWSMS